MKGKLIWVILALALLARIAFIASFPSGFNADESSFGYDAYSILKTGKDQWGTPLPLVLKSFGDYKSPLYTYLTVPSELIFGLSPFAVRLPAAFIGTLSVFAIYLLVKKLSGSEVLSLIGAVLLAVNPWSIMLGRGAFEFGLITFFLPFSIYLFLEKKYSWAALFFGLNLFTYHSAKFITPLVVILLIFLNKKDLAKNKFKKYILPLIIFGIFFTGLLYTFKVGGGSRITERSIIQGALEQGFDERMKALSEGVNPKFAKLTHNKYTVIFVRFKNNYSQYFSRKFFITGGAGEASYGMIPGLGVVNLTELILLAGIIPVLYFKKDYRKKVLFLSTWLLIAPLPAALASGVGYSGNRSSGMIPVLQILAAFGIYGWYLVIKKYDKKVLYFGGFFITLILLFNTFNFVRSYFHTPSNKILNQMGYGNIEAFKWISENLDAHGIVVSRSLSEPQIFIAIAYKWDPNMYQKDSVKWDLVANNARWVDQLPEYSLGSYTIKSIDWVRDVKKYSFAVIKADELPKFINPMKVFYYPDGTPNIYIVSMNQKGYAMR